MNIFDLVNATNIAAYWETIAQQEAPYFGETIFPNVRQVGMTMDWLKGATGAPVALAPSALDTNVVPRGRKGLSKLTQDMAFFKESKYVDEKLRQQLLMLGNSADQTLRDTIIAHIFDDDIELIKGAALRREIIRMEALTTGKAKVTGNGVDMTIDYDMPTENIGASKVAWGDAKGDPFEDFDRITTQIGNKTGATISRVVMNRVTWNTLASNDAIKSTLLASSASKTNVVLPKSVIMTYLEDEYGLSFAIYDKGYLGADGKLVKFIPDGKAVFMPAVDLGNTHFGTTPEEADLLSSNAAQVRIVDTGVAVTTTTKTDPVNVETKVSMMSLPSFEQADSVYVLDTTAGATTTTNTSGSGAASSTTTGSGK
jgi:hypothetical protein